MFSLLATRESGENNYLCLNPETREYYFGDIESAWVTDNEKLAGIWARAIMENEGRELNFFITVTEL